LEAIKLPRKGLDLEISPTLIHRLQDHDYGKILQQIKRLTNSARAAARRSKEVSFGPPRGTRLQVRKNQILRFLGEATSARDDFHRGAKCSPEVGAPR